MEGKIDKLLSEFFNNYADSAPSSKSLKNLKAQYADNIDGLVRHLCLKYTGEQLSEQKLNHIKKTYGLIDGPVVDVLAINILISVLTILFFILLLYGLIDQLI